MALNPRPIWWTVVILGLLILLGIWLFPRIRPRSFHGMVVQSPQPATNFQLTGSQGKPVELQDFQGKYVLLFFGYTSCPDVCPLTLAQLAQAVKQLPADQAERVQTLFVSVDPIRDTPDRLRAYTASFGPGVLGVTGSDPELIAATTQFGVFFERHAETENGAGYEVDHTSTVTIIDPAGYVRLVWPFGLSVEEMGADLHSLLR